MIRRLRLVLIDYRVFAFSEYGRQPFSQGVAVIAAPAITPMRLRARRLRELTPQRRRRPPHASPSIFRHARGASYHARVRNAFFGAVLTMSRAAAPNLLPRSGHSLPPPAEVYQSCHHALLIDLR